MGKDTSMLASICGVGKGCVRPWTVLTPQIQPSDANNANQVSVNDLESTVLETYDVKPSYQYLRWNLLWLLLVVLISPLSLLALVDPSVGLALCMSLQAVLTVAFLFACYHVWMYMWIMVGAVNTPWLDKVEELDAAALAEFKHVVMICTYKEPLDLLRTTLGSLARSTMAHQIIAVVAFEMKTPDRESKINALTEEFASQFFALTCTTHTLLAGEIQGKCSNANSGMREAIHIHLERGNLVPSRTMCTTCDVDSLFHEKYFENLTYNFLSDPDRYNVVWQSPLIYNLGLDGCSVFSRVTGILRTFFMVGFLIPLNVNTMSIFSTSLEMMAKGRFFHPGYQMDDIIYTLTCMSAIRKRVKIRLIEVPTVSGPTSGATWVEDVAEWRVQARRWTIGAAEVFHYYFIKLLHREFDAVSGLGYGLVFTFYYAFILCIGQLNWICNLVVFNALGSDITTVEWGSWRVGDYVTYLTVGGLGFQYITTFFTAFFMDALVRNVLNIDENIGFLRGIAHFVSAQVVLICYNIVEFVAIVEVAWKGKKVCGHKPSNKDNLPATKKNQGKNVSPQTYTIEETKAPTPADDAA